MKQHQVGFVHVYVLHKFDENFKLLLIKGIVFESLNLQDIHKLCVETKGVYLCRKLWTIDEEIRNYWCYEIGS